MPVYVPRTGITIITKETFMRAIFLIIVFFLNTYSKDISIYQCCMLIDVIEDKKIGYETWDFRIASNLNLYLFEVTSYVKIDKVWYSYVWTQEIKGIIPQGNNSYIIRAAGRNSSFDMLISVTVDNERVKKLTAILPIGVTGKNVRHYQLNTSKQTLNIPIHNSAYKE